MSIQARRATAPAVSHLSLLPSAANDEVRFAQFNVGDRALCGLFVPAREVTVVDGYRERGGRSAPGFFGYLIDVPGLGQYRVPAHALTLGDGKPSHLRIASSR